MEHVSRLLRVLAGLLHGAFVYVAVVVEPGENLWRAKAECNKVVPRELGRVLTKGRESEVLEVCLQGRDDGAHLAKGSHSRPQCQSKLVKAESTALVEVVEAKDVARLLLMRHAAHDGEAAQTLQSVNQLVVVVVQQPEEAVRSFMQRLVNESHVILQSNPEDLAKLVHRESKALGHVVEGFPQLLQCNAMQCNAILCSLFSPTLPTYSSRIAGPPPAAERAQ
eukprot:scaffold2263_cov272-Pinguiococcus_pyrenoidosus.AAC.8